MKVLHGLIRAVTTIGVLLLGLYLIAEFFGMRHPFAEFLLSSGFGRLTLGGVLAAAVLLDWLTALPHGRVTKARFLTFDSEGGTVSVSVKAANDFLAKIGREFAGVINLRPDISGVGRAAVEVRLDLTVKSGTKIQELAQLMQQRVRESLRENLGISEVTDVKVNITDIVGMPESALPEREEWQNTL